MKAIFPQELIQTLKNNHLLLDTNVFRDASSRPVVYNEFFNHLKMNDVTLVTIDFVKLELLKGSANQEKYSDKEQLLEKIIDLILPINTFKYELLFMLVKQYGIDGTALSVTDLLLGAFLMQYSPNLFLMTRDTTDFHQNIFTLSNIVNIPHTKGIFTYGIYNYLPDSPQQS